jgi:hypothetical protein
MTRIETGQFEVKVSELQLGSSRRGRRGRRRGGGGTATPLELAGGGASNIALALVGIAAMVGGIWLTNAHDINAGWFCLGMAAFSMLAIMLRR